MKKKNDDIRKLISESGVTYWQVAYALGIHPSTFTAKLRKELSDDEKELVMQAIGKASKEK